MSKKTRLHGRNVRQLRAGSNHFESGVNQRKKAKWLHLHDQERCDHKWESISAVLTLCERCGAIKTN